MKRLDSFLKLLPYMRIESVKKVLLQEKALKRELQNVQYLVYWFSLTTKMTFNQEY